MTSEDWANSKSINFTVAEEKLCCSLHGQSQLEREMRPPAQERGVSIRETLRILGMC